MSKGLEAYKEIIDFVYDLFHNTSYSTALRCNSSEGYLEPFIKQVEKELKALEIIKKKQVNVYNFVWYHEHHKWMNYEKYCEILDIPEEEGCDDTFQLQEFCKCGERLTQEEYDLLKEVLL